MEMWRLRLRNWATKQIKGCDYGVASSLFLEYKCVLQPAVSALCWNSKRTAAKIRCDADFLISQPFSDAAAAKAAEKMMQLWQMTVVQALEKMAQL